MIGTCVVQNIMWDGTQNVAGQFLDTSDGFTFDKTQSTVITVNTNVTTGGTTCDFDGYADAAIAAAQLVGYTAANYGFRCVHAWGLVHLHVYACVCVS